MMKPCNPRNNDFLVRIGLQSHLRGADARDGGLLIL
jgi:hypothetical protein